MNINQKIYNDLNAINPPYARLGTVLFLGFGFCILSLGAGVVLGLFDKRAERITKRKAGNGVAQLCVWGTLCLYTLL